MKGLSGGGGGSTQNDNTVDVVNNDIENNDEICIIFSDLDGTLIHYPDNKEDKLSNKDGLLKLPKSSTGMSGIISSQTLCSIRNIRNGNCGGVGGSNSNVKFVLISGMRTSTFLQRLPYLPKADAYATENGGRIFYPLPVQNINNNNNNNNNDTTNKNTFWVKPKRFKGSTKDDLIPFGIHEDMNWRKKMINTKALGGRGDGYDDRDDDSDGNTSDDNSSGYASFALLDQKQEDVLRERDGLLWDFARDLIHNKHFKIDTKGYSTCFRVNRKHQNQNQRNVESSSENKFIFKFEDLYNGKLLNQPPWIIDDDTNTDNGNNNAIDEDGHIILSEPIQSKIAWSVNLNCVDFYPSISGKKNWYVQ